MFHISSKLLFLKAYIFKDEIDLFRRNRYAYFQGIVLTVAFRSCNGFQIGGHWQCNTRCHSSSLSFMACVYPSNRLESISPWTAEYRDHLQGPSLCDNSGIWWSICEKQITMPPASELLDMVWGLMSCLCSSERCPGNTPLFGSQQIAFPLLKGVAEVSVGVQSSISTYVFWS